jgi:pilus assembly protein Flp/PilA
MHKLHWLKLLRRDQRGTSAVEYGLICGLIVMVMVTALSGFSNVNKSTWNTVSNSVQTAVGQATAG